MSDKVPPVPVPVFNIGDKAKLPTHPTVGTIVEIKTLNGYPHYLLKRPNGSGFMSHWLRGEVLHLVEAAPVADAPHNFQVGDRVRNITLDKSRTVVEIADGYLRVRKDELAGEKSPLWGWSPQSCDLVASVTNDLSPTELTVCANCQIAPRESGNEYCVDCQIELAADILSPAEAAVDSETVAAVVDAGADELLASLRRDLDRWQRQAIQAEVELKKVEAERTKLEKQLIELQNMVVERQPIAVQQPTCIEIKTLSQRIGLSESDANYARHLNDGWEDSHVAITVNADNSLWRTVTFKRIVPTQPAPTIGRAGAHAALTADFVGAQRAVPLTGTIVTENKVEMPISSMVRQYGPEATVAMRTQQHLQTALANSRARRAADPFPAIRPLLPVKAGG